jgi:formate dehydrogenase subunit gamma
MWPPAQAVVRARLDEDVLVGDEVVRHRLAARVIHWAVAFSFLVCLLSGLAIWTPVFGWMAGLLGGLSVCRVIHPWAGLFFFAASMAMFLNWRREMLLTPKDREWLRPRAFRGLGFLTLERDPEVGKYNGGQKVFFYAVSLGALGLLASGFVLWLPTRFGQSIRVAGILLHDVTFVLFAMAIVLHIYLATAAEPGTFRAMTRGTVRAAWARLHHPRWLREVEKGVSPRP